MISNLGFFLISFYNYYFIYLFLSALGLHCCARAFLQLQRAGATLRRGAWASHCGGFSCCRARALGTQALVVVAHGLQSAGSVVVAHGLSCSVASGIFRDQGSNPCPPALAGGFLTTAPPGKPKPRLFQSTLEYCDYEDLDSFYQRHQFFFTFFFKKAEMWIISI